MSKVISVAVCDDDETMLPIIAGVVQATFPAEGATVETFSSAKQFCDRMEEKGFDLLFLDIDMPETDGIELGLKLRNAKRNIDIVYVSEREDRVFESFKVHPFGFVRKRNFLKDIRSVAKLWLDSREAVPADKFVIEGTKGSLAVQLNICHFFHMRAFCSLPIDLFLMRAKMCAKRKICNLVKIFVKNR